jgi:Uma2 family endonuclease
MLTQQKVTLEEFEQFLAQQENRYRLFELINGEIVEKMPTKQYGIIAGKWIQAFNNYLDDHPIGRAGVEIRHRLPNEQQNDYIPDVSFISNDHELQVTEKGAVPQMPDLVVEIKSPDDSPLVMRAKALYYLQHGSKLVVLTFPQKQQLEVHTVESIITLSVDDVFDGGEVLPGFKLAVWKLFS